VGHLDRDAADGDVREGAADLMAAVLLAPSADHTCQFCWYREEAPPVQVVPGETAQRFHPCPAMGGLKVPLKPAGVRCEVRPLERGDYVKDEMVQRGRQGQTPMGFTTERDDGNDVAVLVPCAVLNIKEA
jgi:hypothetical protein